MRDKRHLDSLALVTNLLENRWGQGYVTNHILDETLTLLKYRISGGAAKAFIESIIGSGAIKVLFLNDDTEHEALILFEQYADRIGFSYTDAITVIAMKRYNIDFLLSFDKRSFLGLVERIVGPGYWSSLPERERERILKLAEKHRTHIK